MNACNFIYQFILVQYNVFELLKMLIALADRLCPLSDIFLYLKFLQKAGDSVEKVGG